MQYIYKIENIINHKVYIGLTNGETDKRIEEFHKQLKNKPEYIA